MINIKKIKPLFTSIITTMDVYEEDVKTEGGVLDATKRQGGLKEYQTVVAVGSSVRDIKEGDLVCINPTRFAVRKHQADSLKNGVVTDNPITTYNFNVVVMNDTRYLLLQDRDIDFVIEDWEPSIKQTEAEVTTVSKPTKKKKLVL